jgi:hypothetical protein
LGSSLPKYSSGVEGKIAIERRCGWARMWIRQRDGDILERLLARSATEAVRWTGAGRLCGRGRGRSVGAVVVSTVQLGSQSPISCVLLQTHSNKLCGALSYGLRQSMLRSMRVYGEHGRHGKRTHSPGCCCVCCVFCCCSVKKKCDLEARLDFQKEGMGS